MINTEGAWTSICFFFFSYQIISVRLDSKISESIKLKMKI